MLLFNAKLQHYSSPLGLPIEIKKTHQSTLACLHNFSHINAKLMEIYQDIQNDRDQRSILQYNITTWCHCCQSSQWPREYTGFQLTFCSGHLRSTRPIFL